MGTWNDFLTDTKVLNSTGRANIRHAYDEAAHWKDQMDPDVAGLYATANHVTTLAKHTDTISSGNFTITIAFPLHDVEETTGNIAFDAAEATIQTAIDTALASVNMGTAYTAGDLDVALTGTILAASNNATLTANGNGVKGLYMVVTTANAGDLDADKLGTPVDVTIGTANRPVEQILTQFDVIRPASATPTAQGATVAVGAYTKGDNPKSFSPPLVQALVIALRAESALIGDFVDDMLVVGGLISDL